MVQLVNTSACHAEDRGFKSRRNRHYIGLIAQSVEQRTENPRVTGSIPVETTIFTKSKLIYMKLTMSEFFLHYSPTLLQRKKNEVNHSLFKAFVIVLVP